MADLASSLQRLVSADAAVAAPNAAMRYNTDIVRRAWEGLMRTRRRERRNVERLARAAKPSSMYDDEISISEESDRDPLVFSYIHQLWTDHIVVSADEGNWFSVPYTVNAPGASSSDVAFGTPTRVKETFVAASAGSSEVATATNLFKGNTGSVLLLTFSSSGETVGSPLDRIVAAAASQGGVALSAPPWAKPGETGKKSSEGSDGGLKLKADATLPPGSQAITNAAGKRVGVIKKVGDKFTHSQDNHSQKFDSAEAAKRVFAVKHKASDGAGHGKADGDGKNATKPGETGGKDGNLAPPFKKGS